jgi:hypothetical protein
MCEMVISLRGAGTVCRPARNYIHLTRRRYAVPSLSDAIVELGGQFFRSYVGRPTRSHAHSRATLAAWILRFSS